MIETLTLVLITAGCALLGVLLLAASRPDTFQVSRSRHIQASPRQVFALIEDLRHMNTWNPYALRDPASKVTYSEPSHGAGAYHTFDGGKSGAGRIDIVEVVPDKRLAMRLVMTRPFKADNAVAFTLTPAGSGTEVSWTMSGQQPLLAKCMSLVINCDRMVGRDFEKGLAGLASLAQSSDPPTAARNSAPRESN